MDRHYTQISRKEGSRSLTGTKMLATKTTIASVARREALLPVLRLVQAIDQMLKAETRSQRAPQLLVGEAAVSRDGFVTALRRVSGGMYGFCGRNGRVSEGAVFFFFFLCFYFFFF